MSLLSLHYSPRATPTNRRQELGMTTLPLDYENDDILDTNFSLNGTGPITGELWDILARTKSPRKNSAETKTYLQKMSETNPLRLVRDTSPTSSSSSTPQHAGQAARDEEPTTDDDVSHLENIDISGTRDTDDMRTSDLTTLDSCASNLEIVDQLIHGPDLSSSSSSPLSPLENRVAYNSRLKRERFSLPKKNGLARTYSTQSVVPIRPFQTESSAADLKRWKKSRSRKRSVSPGNLYHARDESNNCSTLVGCYQDDSLHDRDDIISMKARRDREGTGDAACRACVIM